MSAESFFVSSTVPGYLNERRIMIDEFIAFHKVHAPIVLVTSGGTSVPLEKRMVRYIDNFSMGTRGSSSAECFLSQGYAVIFLHRRNSLEPFHRHFSRVNLLDMVKFDGSPHSENVVLKTDQQHAVKRYLHTYEQIRAKNLLLSVTYTSIDEYLHMLRLCAQCLSCRGNHVMLYLAAAVSDFYIPHKDIPEHKIQSSDGPLQLTLQLVPKMLNPLVMEWCPDAFVVSFKLETDVNILLTKSLAALHKYKHQVVVANVLDTRKEEVTLVTTDTQEPIKLTPQEITSGIEIETHIVERLIDLHRMFISI